MTQEEREIIANNCPHWNDCPYPCENCHTFKEMLIMAKKNKELLLKDLCARLPYNPMCEYTDIEDGYKTTAKLGYSLRDFVAGKVLIKPYLRPMSSMTEEEKAYKEFYFKWDYTSWDYVDWLNAHHFDYRGLIPMDLALEATERMYN